MVSRLLVYSRRNASSGPPSPSSPLDVSLQGPGWNTKQISNLPKQQKNESTAKPRRSPLLIRPGRELQERKGVLRSRPSGLPLPFQRPSAPTRDSEIEAPFSRPCVTVASIEKARPDTN